MFFQPPASHLLAVPHIEQHNTGDCLAACVEMVCRYLGVAVQYERLVKLLDIKPGVGAPFSNIEKLTTLQLNIIHQTGGNWAQSYDLLALGWPIITSV
jgi:ABC-type bacteriocin/lantibiotic exporter with double-glycine peptidase domain